MTTLPNSFHSDIFTSGTTADKLTDSNDGTLIRKLQSGDLAALGELYDRHNVKTYQTAYALTHDPTAADDILQDCFLRLHRYAYSIDPTRPLLPWLYRVTVNLSYTWMKRRKRWQIPIETIQEKIIHPNNQYPEKQAEGKEIQDEINQALTSLKAPFKTVIVLYYINALNTQEIAEILGCPIGTVKSRLFYGRKKLRAKLTKSWAQSNMLKYEYA